MLVLLHFEIRACSSKEKVRKKSEKKSRSAIGSICLFPSDTGGVCRVVLDCSLALTHWTRRALVRHIPRRRMTFLRAPVTFSKARPRPCRGFVSPHPEYTRNASRFSQRVPLERRRCRVHTVLRLELSGDAFDNFGDSCRETPAITATPGEQRESGSFRERYASRLPAWLLTRLESVGFHRYTPIQKAALDHFLGTDESAQGEERARDAVVFGETGSGKTLAYLIPLLAAVKPTRSAVQGLVIVPTPELAVQVYRVARRLAVGYLATTAPASSSVPRRDRFLIGIALNEASVDRQRRFFRNAPPRILIGIADRIEALARSNKLRLHSVRMAVIDEVDVSVGEPAYRASLHALLNVYCMSRIEGRRTTVFVSATIPQYRHFMDYARQQGWMDGDIKILATKSSPMDAAPQVQAVHAATLRANAEETPASPNGLELALQRTNAPGVAQLPERIEHFYVICTESRKKLKALAFLLERERPSLTQVIIFCSESRNLDQIANYIHVQGLFTESEVAVLSTALPLRRRRLALERFRCGEVRALFSTDLASRGLDIPETSHVINFDLPETAEQYAHRVGRTGRLGRRGRAISIIVPGERFVLQRYSNRFRIDFTDWTQTSQS